METHVKVCTMHEWSSYFKEEDYSKLVQAKHDGAFIELHNLFGTLEAIDGAMIEIILVSTVETRARYAEFEAMMNEEDRKFRKAYEEAHPEWLEGV